MAPVPNAVLVWRVGGDEWRGGGGRRGETRDKRREAAQGLVGLRKIYQIMKQWCGRGV